MKKINLKSLEEIFFQKCEHVECKKYIRKYFNILSEYFEREFYFQLNKIRDSVDESVKNRTKIYFDRELEKYVNEVFDKKIKHFESHIINSISYSLKKGIQDEVKIYMDNLLFIAKNTNKD